MTRTNRLNLGIVAAACIAWSACGVSAETSLLKGLDAGEVVGQEITESVRWVGDEGEFKVQSAGSHAVNNEGTGLKSVHVTPDRGILGQPFNPDASTLVYRFSMAMRERTHAQGGASLRVLIGDGLPTQAAVRIDVTGVRKILFYDASGDGTFVTDARGEHFQLPQPTEGVTVPVPIQVEVDYQTHRYRLTVDGRAQGPSDGIAFVDQDADKQIFCLENNGIQTGPNANGRYLPLQITGLTVSLPAEPQ